MTTHTPGREWPEFLLAVFLGLVLQNLSYAQAEFLVDLDTVDWIHGSPDCEALKADPDYLEWQQFEYLGDSYIFRQNKCSNYEAPFVYLFLGSESGLLIDTGATEEGGDELLAMVRDITDLPVTVAHSHGHGDHRLGDDSFKNAEGFSVVGIGQSAVQSFFGFPNWPNEAVSIELGGREIEMLPIPGHSDDDLAYYDPKSEIVITGDTLYPGRLYVRNWTGYQDSISRLAEWVESKPVSVVLGTHIEMSSTANVDYPVETIYQPEEHQLPLSVADILKLRDASQKYDAPERVYLDSFIIWPVQ